MKVDTKKINLIITGIVLMLLGLGPFLYLAIRQSNFNKGNIIGISIVVLTAIVLAVFAFSRIKEMKKGEPYDDELSKSVLITSASRSFFISFYWLLALMLFEPLFADLLFDSENLNAPQVIGGAISGMILIFLLNWLYYQKKGIK